MKKFVSLGLVLSMILTLASVSAFAATAYFDAYGEQYTNEVFWSSKCQKSTDGDNKFYVTVQDVFAMQSDDKVYFGPRLVTSDGSSYGGALCGGLSYYLAKNPRQSMSYSSSVPGGRYYVLNVKQATDGPGTFFYLDIAWTP